MLRSSTARGGAGLPAAVGGGAAAVVGVAGAPLLGRRAAGAAALLRAGLLRALARREHLGLRRHRARPGPPAAVDRGRLDLHQLHLTGGSGARNRRRPLVLAGAGRTRRELPGGFRPHRALGAGGGKRAAGRAAGVTRAAGAAAGLVVRGPPRLSRARAALALPPEAPRGGGGRAALAAGAPGRRGHVGAADEAAGDDRVAAPGDAVAEVLHQNRPGIHIKAGKARSAVSGCDHGRRKSVQGTTHSRFFTNVPSSAAAQTQRNAQASQQRGRQNSSPVAAQPEPVQLAQRDDVVPRGHPPVQQNRLHRPGLQRAPKVHQHELAQRVHVLALRRGGRRRRFRLVHDHSQLRVFRRVDQDHLTAAGVDSRCNVVAERLWGEAM